MNCPKCKAEMPKVERHGIEVEICPADHGIWLDAGELDELEDQRFSEDDLKGSLVFPETASGAACPVCKISLVQFNYRLSNLYVEYCVGEARLLAGRRRRRANP